jgi:hypothetical protein
MKSRNIIREEIAREEIIRDNRVARLLWFALGFILSFFIFNKL